MRPTLNSLRVASRRLKLAVCALAIVGALLVWTSSEPSPSEAEAAQQAPAGRIIFGHKGDIWIAENGRLSQITEGGRYWGEPDWSPDGTRIALIGWGQNATELFVLEPGGELQQLTRSQQRRLADNDWIHYPRWSPDGELIAYLSDRSSEYAMLWTMHPDGTGARQMFNARSGLSAVDSLSWAPDGSRIAVTGFKDSGSQIYIVDISRPGPLRQLTSEPGGAFDPAWSPDGGYIAYVTRDGRNTQIRLIDADGQGPASTIVQGEYPRSPRWSPYGSELAYMALAGQEFELFVVPIGLNADGEHVAGRSTQITRQFGVDSTSAIAWSW